MASGETTLMTAEQSRLDVLSRTPDIASPQSGERFNALKVLGDPRIAQLVGGALGDATSFVEQRGQTEWVLTPRGDMFVADVLSILPGRGIVPDDQTLKRLAIVLQEDAWNSPRSSGTLSDADATWAAWDLAARLSGKPDVRFPNNTQPFSVFDLAEPRSAEQAIAGYVPAPRRETHLPLVEVTQPGDSNVTGYSWKVVG